MELLSGDHVLLAEAANEEPLAAKSRKNLGDRTYPHD